MRIGIDCRTILNPELGEQAGIGHYTYFLVTHLLEVDKENEYVLFFDSRMPDINRFEQANVKTKRFHFSQYKKFLPFGYSHMLIAALIAKERLSVFHSPANITPLAYRGRTVVTVHDLAIYKNPEWFPSQIFSTRLLVPQSLKRAKHVIAVSESTKKDLHDLFDISSSKISVIHEAPFVSPINVKDRNVDVVKKFKLRKPYVLFIGSLEPRKNIGSLLAAFRGVHERHPNIELVIAGGLGYKGTLILDTINAYPKNAVRYIGYVTHNEKLALYKNALAFAFPSLYEGFGLPVLEAMALNVPVLTSNVSSLPEIATATAAMVKPLDVGAMRRSLERMVSDESYRKSLAEKGKNRARQFTWDRVAKETLEVYKKVGKNHRSSKRTNRSKR